MSIVGSLLLFKAILIAGLAVWMTIIVINNATAFAGGVATIGLMMSMQLFDQPPVIKTPLLARRVIDPGWHKAAYALVLVAEIVVAALLIFAAIGFAGALFGAVDPAAAIQRSNLALSALLAMSFLFVLGGAWFAYYVKQDGMQTMHFVLIAVATTSAIAINLPAA